MIAQPLQEIVTNFENDTQPFRRVLRLVDCFEWIIKWSTSLAVCDLFNSHGFSDRTKLLAAEGLRTPSLGLWVRFLRAALDELPPHSVWREWDRVIDAEDRHQIVSFRNKLAHGAVPSDAQCEADLQQYLPVLGHLLESRTLAVELQEPQAGRRLEDGWTATVAVPSPDPRVLDLWPLAIYLPTFDSTGELALHFFNALREPRIETLNYEVPDRQRRRNLWDHFHRVLPLDDWRKSLHELDPFRDEIRSLTENFKGRHDERRHLSEFFRSGGMLFLMGPPGIGKSALVASSLAGDDPSPGTSTTEAMPENHLLNPVVIEHFIRRGQVSSRPHNFLSGVLRRLDAFYGFTTHKGSFTEDELFVQLKSKVSQIRSTFAMRPLVLVIDGLDEGIEIGRYLIHGDARVRVLCTGRPTPEVHEILDGWVQDGAHSMKLAALSESDVRAMLYDVVNKYDRRLNNAFVAALTERAEGNPLFLTLYAQEIFDKPELLGDTSVIPHGLSAVLANGVKRVCRGGQDDVAFDLLCALAVAKEPLDAPLLGHVLGHRQIRVRAAISDCLELLNESESSLGVNNRYQLFHETLREWLELTYPEDLASIRNLFADVSGQTSTVSDDYLGRWGLRHLAEVTENESSPHWANLFREIVDVERLLTRLSVAEMDLVVSDVLFAHQVADPEVRDQIEDALAQAILRDLEGDNPRLSAESVHSLFAYRDDLEFYDSVLLKLNDVEFARSLDLVVSQTSRAGLLHCLGTRERRRSGSQGNARSILEKAATVASVDPDHRYLSRIHYDLAYLHFLQGNIEEALMGFEQSHAAAERHGDVVAAHIALCLNGLVQWHAGTDDGQSLRGVLLDALAVFVEESGRSQSAERWVRNANLHLFDLALERRDGAEAAELLDAVRCDPWNRRYRTSGHLGLYEARLDLCEGRAEQTIRQFELAIEQVGGQYRPDSHVEQLARLYLELGSALDTSGFMAEASTARIRAQSLARSNGNWMWQERQRPWPP